MRQGHESGGVEQLRRADPADVMQQLRAWAHELGFSQIGVADVDLHSAEPGLLAWLEAGFHGHMDYMAAHGLKRARPAELVPGTVRVVTARMDYLPATLPTGWQHIGWERLQRPAQAVVSLYAQGRDYHKVMRQRLQRLADRLAAALGPFGHRVFTDSAPVLEVELAQRSGIGWRGKHTLVLSREAGSMFFLGEIYVDWPLPLTEPVGAHCGSCEACIAACPTGAIVAPYRLDARRCISYLTIELDGPIPQEFRAAIGNRIYGCDDCLAVCPWNKFAESAAANIAFAPRAELAAPALADLLALDDRTFREVFSGSPIKRIGRDRMVRNAAIAAGNSGDTGMLPCLDALSSDPSEMVREAAQWALGELTALPQASIASSSTRAAFS